MSSEIAAALLGVLAGGVIQAIVGHFDRRREAESVLTSLGAEVDSICRLIRHRGYLLAVRALLDHIREGGAAAHINADIRQDYFSVFNALAPKLGTMSPTNAAKIVNFYAYCKSVIDSVYPDGNLSRDAEAQDLTQNLVEVEKLLTAILVLGDEIVQMPKLSLARQA